MARNLNGELPPPSVDQAFCNVSALESGTLGVRSHLFVDGVSESESETKLVPSLSFLLRHSSGDQKKDFIFDLGIRSDFRTKSPPRVLFFVENYLEPCVVTRDSATSLREGANGILKPEDIPFICPSHCHWDHVGDPGLWPNATFLVSEEAKVLFEPGYPTDPQSGFPSDLFPKDRTRWLDTSNDEEWKPLGPFPRAMDFFNDGSLFVVDSPGHLQGHLNVLARTSRDGGWIFLGGDSVHDARILRGEAGIAVHPVIGCIHVDKVLAEEHIARMRSLESGGEGRVRVLVAHDGEWYEESLKEGGKGFWPGRIESL